MAGDSQAKVHSRPGDREFVTRSLASKVRLWKKWELPAQIDSAGLAQRPIRNEAREAFNDTIRGTPAQVFIDVYRPLLAPS
jgi:hypothetical protein